MHNDRHNPAAIWPADDGTYDGLPPADAYAGDWFVDRLTPLLDGCANLFRRDADTALDMQDVLEILLAQSDGRSDLRLSERQRDTLLGAMAWARGPVLALFATPAEYSLAVKGFDAAAACICILAESDKQRAARLEKVWTDIRAHARWLRNALENVGLMLGVEARAAERRSAERRSATVAEIMRRAAA